MTRQQDFSARLSAFAKGKQQVDGVGVSRCATHGTDYHLYYAAGMFKITWFGHRLTESLDSPIGI